MKKILVTGANGFIGRNALHSLLLRGYEIHGVYSKRVENIPNIFMHQADLLDPQKMVKLMADVQPTHLLHFAWYTEPDKYWDSPENFRWVEAGLSLLREFRKQGGKRVVFAGTCAEYNWSMGKCSEHVTPLKPTTVYSICKHSLQLMQDIYSRTRGLSNAWGRIFCLYGPHEHPNRLVSSVIKALLQKNPVPCSHGNQIRDFLHVNDAASAFVALLDSDIQGPVNIGSGNPVSLKEILFKIAEKIGGADLIQLGKKPVSPIDPSLLVADTHRLVSEVNWTPKYSLDSGLDQTIEWWRNQIEAGLGN